MRQSFKGDEAKIDLNERSDRVEQNLLSAAAAVVDTMSKGVVLAHDERERVCVSVYVCERERE